MKKNLIIGLVSVLVILILVLCVVLPIVLIKKNSTTSPTKLPQQSTRPETIGVLDANSIFYRYITTQQGFIKNTVDDTYLIIVPGKPITSTKNKQLATLVTIGDIEAQNLQDKRIQPYRSPITLALAGTTALQFAADMNPSVATISIFLWDSVHNIVTNTLSSSTGNITLTGLKNASLYSVGLPNYEKNVLTTAMTFDSVSPCPTCITTFDVV